MATKLSFLALPDTGNKFLTYLRSKIGEHSFTQDFASFLSANMPPIQTSQLKDGMHYVNASSSTTLDDALVEVEKFPAHSACSLQSFDRRSQNGNSCMKLNYEDTDDKEWEVEAILDERKSKANGRDYLVKWRGFDKLSDNTWEPYEHVMELEALDRWEEWKEEVKAKRIHKRMLKKSFMHHKKPTPKRKTNSKK